MIMKKCSWIYSINCNASANHGFNTGSFTIKTQFINSWKHINHWNSGSVYQTDKEKSLSDAENNCKSKRRKLYCVQYYFPQKNSLILFTVKHLSRWLKSH